MPYSKKSISVPANSTLQILVSCSAEVKKTNIRIFQGKKKKKKKTENRKSLLMNTCKDVFLNDLLFLSSPVRNGTSETRKYVKKGKNDQ